MRFPASPTNQKGVRGVANHPSLSPRERDDFALVCQSAHDARCIAPIRSAGVDDPDFSLLCEEALHGEGLPPVDLRGATPYPKRYPKRLPEDCMLAARALLAAR